MNISMMVRRRPVASGRLLAWVSLAASLAIAFALFGPVRSLDAQGKSVRNGIYTTEQANRGEKLFMGVGRCYACHQRDMQGNALRGSKQLAGSDFVSDFSDRPLDDLFYKIQMTMPADLGGRGTLMPDQVTDLIAFLLEKNGYPAGSQDLTTDRGQLKMIKFEAPK